MTGEFEICTFTMDYYERVYRMWRTVFPDNTDSSYSKENIMSFLSRNPGTSFVALHEGSVLGAVLAGHDGRRGYIYHLGVYEEFRGKKIGKSLLKKTEAAFSELGLPKAQLSVFTHNTPAKMFYESLGYNLRSDLDVFTVNL